MSLISIGTRVQTLEAFTTRIGGTPYTDRLAAVVQRMRTSTATLGDVFDSRDPTETDAAHTVRVSRAAKILADRAKSCFDDIQKIMAEGMASINSRKLAKVPLVPNEYAAEIRERVRDMGGEQTELLMRQLAAENKANELAAITEVPAILTGVTENQQSKYRDLIFRTYAESESAEQDVLFEAFNAAMTALGVMEAAAGDYANQRSVAEIVNAQQRAVKADKAMNAEVRMEALDPST